MPSVMQTVADKEAKQAEIARRNQEMTEVFQTWKMKKVKAIAGPYKGHTGVVVGIDPRPRHFPDGMWLTIRCDPDTEQNHVAPSETASKDMFHCLPSQIELIK